MPFKNAGNSATLLALSSFFALPNICDAQANYPTRTIRFVVGYSPGGATDLAGRFVADNLSAALGQQIVVDNRPGAGSMLATEMVASAAADGHTILLANATVSMPSLFPDLKFDMVKDLRPVSVLGYSNLVLTVHPSMPVRSVQDLIALAKRRPNEMNYALAGKGSFIHLAAELMGEGDPRYGHQAPRSTTFPATLRCASAFSASAALSSGYVAQICGRILPSACQRPRWAMLARC
jgi:tripartite-type tricarboxylate transporter receptor subunit TctC